MTTEEAIKILSRPKTMKNTPEEILKAHNMAIKALEQEPCEDAISRQAVLNYIRDNYRRWFINDDAFMQCVNGMKDIVPVNPQPKTGHWIDNHNGTYTCDECGCNHSRSNYCPDCGCRMFEPQESEDKDEQRKTDTRL